MKPLLQSSLLALALSLPAGSRAGDDHEPAASASPSSPQRLPDGSVFLPKPAQRQMALRTLHVSEASLPRAFELNGRVSMDPDAGGQVQTLQMGRLEAGPRGLPALGQRVRKGEVLAYLRPASATLERSAQAAQLAEIKAAQGLAEKRLLRLRELADTVPAKDIETAQGELASLRARAAALSAGLNEREALLAPVAGMIASARAVAGQVLEARELVFEVVDPNRLRIEALAYDLALALAQDVAGASMVAGEKKITLDFIGSGLSLREQALPLSFKAQGQDLRQLALGQPVKLTVQTRSRQPGFAVPAAALLRNPANQTIVWVKLTAERFEPRAVQVAPLDASSVLVTAGLKTGEAVVGQGAGLLNQIR